MAIVRYLDPTAERKNSWVRYLLYRIEQNKNNLIVVTGATGSGKTYSAMAICEEMSRQNGIPFTIDHIVFTLIDLMKLIIDEDKTKKGTCIIFDEPQTSIGAREFQSEANKVFNSLVTTFRHRNLTLLFCTPFEDLLDKTTRKLFHAKFTTMSINKDTQTVKLKPVTMEYNAQQSKFYEKYLRVQYKEPNKVRLTIAKLKTWDIPKPSENLIKLYEAKKFAFTSRLNQDIVARLETYNKKQDELINKGRKELTDKQKTVVELMVKYKDVNEVAKITGLSPRMIYTHLEYAKKKGYTPKNYIIVSSV